MDFFFKFLYCLKYSDFFSLIINLLLYILSILLFHTYNYNYNHFFIINIYFILN